MSQPITQDVICCPEFDPLPWEDKIHQWSEKPFVKASIPTFLHMPLPSSMNKMMGQTWKMIQDAKADPAVEEFCVISKDPSPWRSDYYFAVVHEVAGACNTKISGTFISKVYDGDYRHTPKFIKLAKKSVEAKGHKMQDTYVFYTTCPKCAKKWGHNYIVVFVKI